MIRLERRVSILILCLIIIFIVGCIESKVKVAPKLNAKAPSISVSNIEGEKINTDEIKNKTILVSFWKIESPSSLRQLKALQRIKNKYGDKVKILAINVEDKTSVVNDFVYKNDYDYDIILDRDGKVSTKYNLSILPTTFLIDEDGIIKEIKKYDDLTEADPLLK